MALISAAHGMPGLLIAFEGLDGTGKSTQLQRLAAHLRAQGGEVVCSFEPTDGPWGRKIRAAARSGERLPIEDELAAFLADRQEHVEGRIRPALLRGSAVLLDRYYFSTIAYQGARGLDPVELQRANEAIAPRPDATLLFQLSPEAALERVRARGATDAFETLEALAPVDALFARIPCPSIRPVRADGSPDEVFARVLAAALAPGSHGARWAEG